MMKVPKGSGFHNTSGSWGKAFLIQSFQLHNQSFWALLFQDKAHNYNCRSQKVLEGIWKNLSNTQESHLATKVLKRLDNSEPSVLYT